MNLHELSPAPGSKRVAVRVGRGLGSGLGKTSGKGQKVRNPVPAVLSALDLKVVKDLCTCVFLNAVSTINLVKIMLKSTFPFSTVLKTAPLLNL